MEDFGARIWYNRGVDNVELEEAFLKFRERLERLAAQTLPPVLSRRVSPEDVVQETMVAVSRDDSPFMSNPDLPLYFKLRTALLHPGDLPNPGIKPRSLALQADSLPAELLGKPKNTVVGSLSLL